MGFLSTSKKEDTRRNKAPVSSSSKWTSTLLKAASSVRASAEAGMTKLGNEFSQAFQTGEASSNTSSNSGNATTSNGQVEACPICHVRFASAISLVEHVKKTHEKDSIRPSVMKTTLDICPRCSRGFRDPVALVEHVEKDHAGYSKA